MSKPDVFVFAGGRSSRMGHDKALLSIGGRTLLDRIVAAARPVARRIVLVGRDGDEHGLAWLPDERPGLGPLAALETALQAAESELALALACDLPFVSTALLAHLVARAAETPDRLVVPDDASGRQAWLCIVVPTSLRPIVTRLLDAGERRPRALAEQVAVRSVPFAEYAHLPDAERLLVNVNTPEELAAARRSR